VGDNPDHVKHLSDCSLICKEDFTVELPNVELIQVRDPQLYFYELSSEFKEDYLLNDQLIYSPSTKAYIHKDAEIGSNVIIGSGAVISKVRIEDNAEIHSNCVIYAKSVIGKNSIIEANTTIGGTGVMWVWDNQKNRVILEQLGNVIIEQDCRIGTQCGVVRGSANETTRIGEGTVVAHGTFFGHGNDVGKYNHFANGVKLGGGCSTADYTFMGSGSILSAGKSIKSENVVLGAGAGAVATKDIIESGVYIGCPATRIKPTKGKMSGIPLWDVD
jgi:UDP-3-O-[3-hydroxymyristoyl] glucosamine N-acyltransferase